LVAGEHGNQEPAGLVDLEDRQRVVRGQLGKRVRDPFEDGVQALLGEDVVEDVGEPPVRLDAPVDVGRRQQLQVCPLDSLS
jgi:hypothetical protein